MHARRRGPAQPPEDSNVRIFVIEKFTLWRAVEPDHAPPKGMEE